MTNGALKNALRDPAYLDLHMQAVAALIRVEAAKWYDSRFLHLFEAAKLYLSWVNPIALGAFTDGFAPIQADPSFKPIPVDDLFDERTQKAISELAAQMPEGHLEHHETEDFGRLVVHDHPYFVQLQTDIMGKVETLIGRKLSIGYNFLSLYGTGGQCEVHLDEPLSMYTLDYCIAQTKDWPIHISDTVDWPSSHDIAAFDPGVIKADPANGFTAYHLRPGSGLIFNGSSQWHYRNPTPPAAVCNLLFFHYYPADCEDLVHPSSWAKHFAIPELSVFCDLIGDDQAT